MQAGSTVQIPVFWDIPTPRGCRLLILILIFSILDMTHGRGHMIASPSMLRDFPFMTCSTVKLLLLHNITPSYSHSAPWLQEPRLSASGGLNFLKSTISTYPVCRSHPVGRSPGRLRRVYVYSKFPTSPQTLRVPLGQHGVSC